MNLISSFLRWYHGPVGFGSAGIRRQRVCGALSIIGATGFTSVQRGIESAETGIICRRFIVRYFAEVNDKLAGISGETVVRAISGIASRDVTVEGEVNGATGIMAFTIGQVVTTLANDVSSFGASAGKIILDEATETQDRTGWRSVNVRLSSNPLLA